MAVVTTGRGRRRTLTQRDARLGLTLMSPTLLIVLVIIVFPLLWSILISFQRLRLIEILVRGTLPWYGDEGYKKAEVTGGGLNLAEVDSQTLESRKHKGLFLCGEMLDAFGPIGGYNFLWAWATGRAAGIGAATKCYA